VAGVRRLPPDKRSAGGADARRGVRRRSLPGGSERSGLSANLSAIAWFHACLDPPVVDVTAVAKTVLRWLRGDGADKPLSPAPVLSVGALEAMATGPARLARKRSARLLRHLSKVEPRQLLALTVNGVRVADDGGFVDLTVPAVPASRTWPALAARSVRLHAGSTILDCPVEAARALVADVVDGQLFTTRLLYMTKVDAYDPYDPAETTALRLAARNRALLCVGYAGALRAEELSTARLENLEPLGSGYRLRLPSTKTSRDGASQAVVLEPVAGPLDPVRAVDRWLAVRGDADGPLFGTVHHALGTDHGMPPDELRGVLQDLAVQVGLPPTISAHSLRRSWATHAYLRDPDSLGAISIHLRHARITNTTRYIEDLTTHLLDREQLLSTAAVVAGPGGQAAPARDLGFDRSPLDELVGVALRSSRPGWPFAPSTLQGYASYWATWERWAAEHSFASFPADPRHVALFAAARAQAGIAPATLRGQLRALEAVHEDHGLPTVGFVRLAADIIAGLERGRTAPRRQAPVVPLADLLRMARYASEQGDLASLRDLVMLTVGYAGGLRVDDLHRAQLEHLERVPAGYVLRFSVSKENQTGRRPEAVLLAARADDLDPVAAVDRWRAASGLTTGPLLSSRPGTSGTARSIGKDTISDRLARLAARSGCTIRPTGHSLRRSWATHAYEAGLDLLSISRQLRPLRPVPRRGRPARYDTPKVEPATPSGSAASGAATSDGWTVAAQLQARLAPLAAGNPQLERLAQVCVQLASNSRAQGSKAVYEQHWRTFVLFCQTVGLPADLPVPAESLACFLAYLAEFGRVDRSTGERGGTGAPLRHGYLRQAVSAIGYRHDLQGLPSPVNDPVIRGVLRGYGRLHGTDVRGKDPIRLDALTRIAAALTVPPVSGCRDRPLVLLATHPGLALNAGQLTRLDAEHLLLAAHSSRLPPCSSTPADEASISNLSRWPPTSRSRPPARSERLPTCAPIGSGRCSAQPPELASAGKAC
jgi:integrase